MIKYAVYIVFLFLMTCAHASPIEQSFIPDPERSDHRIEFFTLRPKGDGPFPVLFLLHGHQPPQQSLGGKQLTQLPWLNRFLSEGIVSVSISIPGFGNSDGDRDFCGPDSQKAIAAVIEHFRHLPYIDSQRMGIYGVSKGATLASMVHSYTSCLALQILEAGWYDLTTCLDLLPDYLEKIKMNLILETGGSISALKQRSAVYHLQSQPAETLILVGELDDRRTLPSAKAFHEKLCACGKNCQLKVYPNELHCLSNEKWETILPFIRAHFFDTAGIGINPVFIMPAIQVAKILPGSPAAQSGKIKVGDVVLRVSPNNDEEEIDTLRMDLSQFISLILGKKGSAIRLHVQHFDQTQEDIILRRG